MPFKKGDKYYFYKNDGLQSQSILYVQDSPTTEAKVFMDPNQLSNDGTIALGGTYFSNDHKYLGYAVSIAGSDWRELHVKNLSTGELLPDHLKWVKFSGMAWHGDGFYYKRYPTPDENEKLSAANELAKVYYHRLGTSQEADELIFFEPDKPKLAPSISVSDDERFLFLYRSSSTYGNMLAFKETKLDEENWTHIVNDLNSNCWILDNRDTRSSFILSKHCWR